MLIARIAHIPRLTVLLLVFGACGLVSFDVGQDIPAQTVPGSPLGALLPPGLFNMPLQIDLEGSTKARGTGPATAAYLKSMTLTITSPAGGTFSFLDSITISIASPGQPETKIASLAPVPAQATIALTVVPNVNLLPYLNGGATISGTATGHAPAQDTTFNGHLVVTIKI
jgi:hypothetical protein